MEPTLPPGPSAPRAVQTLRMWTRPVPYQRALRRRYGPVVTMDIAPFGGRVVSISDPADLRVVFAGDPAVLRAGEANSMLGGVLGDSSVLLLDGAEHRARRRQMLPPFHRDAVRRQTEEMARIAAEAVAGWPVGREFPVAPRMSAITLEVILSVVLGARDPERLAALRPALSSVVDMGPLELSSLVEPRLLRLPPWAGVRRRRARADELVFAEIAACRADENLAERPDVLAMLVRAEGGDAMTDRELRDQLMTLLLAGHETTATALSWAVERLTRHPELLARAVRAADQDDTDYLDALVKETLRIRPVIDMVGRVLAEPVELAGYRLPAGTTVAPAIALAHHAAGNFPDPDRFDPDRMLGVNPDPTRWLPFGGGGRRCLGATFAQVEMRVVLREVLRRVELAGTDAPDEQPRVRHVTTVPARGARTTVTRRRAVPTAVGQGAAGADLRGRVGGGVGGGVGAPD